MAYRNKTYVCFDGDNDIKFYRLMCAWKQHEGIDFNFYNAHDLNVARDSSQDESIKRQLQVRMKNTSVFIVLIGKRTRYLHRFVSWEMEQAIRSNIPIIAANINGLIHVDSNLCPPLIRAELAIHVSFRVAILQHALKHWPASHKEFKLVNKSGARNYPQSTYQRLGL